MKGTKTLVVSIAVGAVFGTAVLASSHMGHRMSGDHASMMGMMNHTHNQAQDADRGWMRGELHHGGQGHMPGGMHGAMHGAMHGGMHGGMHGAMQRMLDADGDGAVTPEEASERLQAMLEEYDADANGTLSISEYESLHSAMIREMMVDRFQHLDADGDGQITSDEMQAPARFMMHTQRMGMRMNPDGTGSSSGDGMDETGSASEN